MQNNKVENNSTDTDYMFNLIANPEKIKETNINELSEIKENSENVKSDSSVKIKSIDKEKSPKENEEKINTPSNKIPLIFNVDIKEEKISYLRKLSELKMRGYTLSKDYDLNSNLEDIKHEYVILKSYVDKKNGTKIIKNSLIHGISILEFLNEKYDPFEFQLTGFSNHLNNEADNWEDVFGDLYEKYKSKGEDVSPELKLLFLILTSACAFHFSKSYSSKLPNFEKFINTSTKNQDKKMKTNKEEIKKNKPKIEKNKDVNNILQKIKSYTNNDTNKNINKNHDTTTIITSSNSDDNNKKTKNKKKGLSIDI